MEAGSPAPVSITRGRCSRNTVASLDEAVGEDSISAVHLTIGKSDTQSVLIAVEQYSRR